MPGPLVAPVSLYRQTVHVELPQPTGGVTSQQQVEERRHGALEAFHGQVGRMLAGYRQDLCEKNKNVMNTLRLLRIKISRNTSSGSRIWSRGGAKNFFPRFCRRSEAKLDKQSEQYNISI